MAAVVAVKHFKEVRKHERITGKFHCRVDGVGVDVRNAENRTNEF
jgi:hypothetical protein